MLNKKIIVLCEVVLVLQILDLVLVWCLDVILMVLSIIVVFGNFDLVVVVVNELVDNVVDQNCVCCEMCVCEIMVFFEGEEECIGVVICEYESQIVDFC